MSRLSGLGIILLIYFLSACDSVDKVPIEPMVMLSFDDTYVDDWFNADSIFQKYDAKVTFFVTHLLTLDSMDFDKLRILQERGHEIGCHSLRHYDPAMYIDSAGIEKYLETEVDPALAILREKGFIITSFAFPFGNSTQALRDSLKSRMLFLRGGIYNKTDILHRSPRSLDGWNVYVENPTQIFTDAMGIDEIYNNTIGLIKPGIGRCIRDSVGLVLYAHRIDENGGDYAIHPSTLDSILFVGKSKNVRFATFSSWRSNEIPAN